MLHQKSLTMAISSILLLSTQLMLLETPTLSAFPPNPQGDGIVAAVGRRPQLKIFHPPTNSCILRTRPEDPLKLAPCQEVTDSWKYTPQKFLTVSGTYYCLQAVGPSLPAKLSIICTVSDSQWIQLTESKPPHLSSQIEDGTVLCLDVNDHNTIITNPCRNSSSDDKAAHEDDSQWFEITTFS